MTPPGQPPLNPSDDVTDNTAADASTRTGTGTTGDPVLPDVLWVRHQGEVHQIPVCPDSRPYSTAVLFNVMRGWQAGEPVEPQTVVQLVDDTQLVVSGAGTADDPMYCEQLQDKPLPECHCADYVDDLDPALYTADDTDGTGSTGDPAVVRSDPTVDRGGPSPEEM